VFVHATGFCKEMWRPVVRRLSNADCVAIDQRGHGDSDGVDPPLDWWDLGRDVLSVVEGLHLEQRLFGVGHSSGATALAMAEVMRPGTFEGLVLVEPIVFPGPHRPRPDHPLAIGARRRRAAFGSREMARGAFHGRGPFARWTDEALDLYVEHGFRDGTKGTRRLACPPEVEAEFYRTAGLHGAWDRLPEIRCPVGLVVGADSHSHTPEFATGLLTRFGHGSLSTVLGCTHFVPMEDPEAVAAVVGAAMAQRPDVAGNE
jgi:pimeloyl-ACP methyl ester carboxylesterase